MIIEDLLKSRYLLPEEDWEGLCQRVSSCVSSIENDKIHWKNTFFNCIYNKYFFPSSPILVNAGCRLGMLSSCFILGIEDSIESILETVKEVGLVTKMGGGVGFSVSKLRPKGDKLKSTSGVSSGPVSFLSIFNTLIDVISQGGFRKGGCLGSIKINHPDVIEFITEKQKSGRLNNFNLSISIPNKFMKALEENNNWELYYNKVYEKKPAKYYWNTIINSILKSSEPGVLFTDTINKDNVFKSWTKIKSSNLCGEYFGINYSSCNLASINLVKFSENGKFNWTFFRKIIRIAVRFLDNVITVNKYPLKKIEDITINTRPIGLGIMGLADCLIDLKLKYGEKESIKFCESLAEFLFKTADEYSQELAYERGEFNYFDKSNLKYKRRNSSLISIAPTGSISILADNVTSGIEPIFNIISRRWTLEGNEYTITNNSYSKYCDDEEYKDLFVCSHDISPEKHIKIQGAFAKYVDGGISKTINCPSNITADEIDNALRLAWELKCKGTTIFVENSREKQVIYRSSEKKCPECKSDLIARDGCYYCSKCVWAKCSVS